MTRPLFPAPTLLQGKRYVPAADTNVQKAWRATDWQPKHKPPRPLQ